MEEKREFVKRETKEREFGDENVNTVLFTAGTALLMVGLKRAVMIFFIEQWRLWVFFILNLVLLAIFFTSMHFKSSDDSKKKTKNCGGENEEKKECVYWSCDEHVEAKNSCKNNKLRRESRDENEEESREGEEEEEKEEEEVEFEPPRLSKEELNERVEAFIATFRRHLVLDARKGRELQFISRQQKQPERFKKLQKSRRSNTNVLTQGGRGCVLQAN